ncbi:MAG: LuxR C-terminal-related transcriptional regulator [Eggerthellaceae bacterium]|nr:LuxR C-terminal-related transcriptional regulator [Eggerthellaceae bacterium]
MRGVGSIPALSIGSLWPLGFAFQTLWTPLIVRQNFVDHGGADIHLAFYSSFGLFALAVAAVFLLRRLDRWAVPYVGICAFSILCKLFASVVLTLDLFAGSTTVALLGAVVGAVGAMASMLVWGSFFKDLPLEQSMSYILISYAINFLLQPLCYMAFPAAALPVLSLLAVGGPLCLVFAYNGMRKGLVPSLAPSSDGANGAKEANGASRANGAVPGGAVPGGIDGSVAAGSLSDPPRKKLPFLRLLFAFAVYSLVLTLRSPVSFLSGNLAIVILYYTAALVALVLYWAVILRRASFSFVHMMQLLLAVFAVGFFLQPFTPHALSDIPPALLMVATALIYMLVWMAVVDITRASKSHPFAVVGVWGACYGCPRLLYFAATLVFPLNSAGAEAAVTTALIALFGLFVAFFLVSRQSSQSHSFFHELAQADRNQDDAAMPLAEWQEIAREHGLTERECEVFYIACEGRSRRYIAETLFISENTVKAHLKRIYAKMGIHSKYDLEKIANADPPRPKEEDPA